MNQNPPIQPYIVTDMREKSTASSVPDRSIGAILIKMGRLSVADAERVMRHQVERNVRFGDAALALGVLTEADIEFALSRQYDYPYLLRGESAISESVVAAYEPFTERVESLRALRNQLMWRWFDTGEERKALAITGDRRSPALPDTPTMADCCLVPQLFSASRFGLDLAPFPTLRAIDTVCQELPAVQRAHPARQPDSE